MSYYGTVLMTRADVVMSRLPRIEAIGFRHRRLREFGDGWQILETSGWRDPPDLEQAVAEAAELWKAPVFAAYVSDVCAQIHGVAAGAAMWSGHLADPGDVHCGMRHRPSVRAGGTLDALETQIVDWAAGAGLAVSVARLRHALRYRLERQDDSDGPHLDQVGQIFEVVRAFGFPAIPALRAYEFDPDDAPFAEVTGNIWGLAKQAHSAAAYRAADAEADSPARWEAEAMTLELDIYAGLYGGGHPVPALAARARRISAAYRAAQPPLPRESTVNGQPMIQIQPIRHTRMVTNRLRGIVRDYGKPKPNGATFHDPATGPGMWPDLA